jgi:DNA-binding NarL/FixJ family response regulator
MNTAERVLIAEDVPASAAWLAQAVAAAFPRAEVTAAETVAAAKAALASAPPALALVDLDLPDGSGTEVIEALVHLPRRPVVIVATVFADDQHVFPPLRAGALGYVLKDATIGELAESLGAAMRGDAVLAARVAKRLVGWFHDPAAGDGPALSPRERELLQLLAKGLTIAEAAAALGIAAGTAASYTKTLYRKLDATTRAEATPEATRRGLIRL